VNPSAPEAILDLGRAQWIDGRSKEAAATFEKAVRLFPRDARLHQEYGRMLLTSGDSSAESRAILLLKTAISLDGLLADSYYELGNLALNKDKPREALGYVETAAKLKPDRSRVHYALARAYRRRLGRNDEYRREIRAFQTLKAHEDKSNDATPSTGGRSQ
jgi:Flp pilus assembly protein TadD